MLGISLVGWLLVAPCALFVAHCITVRSPWRVPGHLVLSGVQIASSLAYYGAWFLVEAKAEASPSRMLPWGGLYTIWAFWVILPLSFAYTAAHRIIEVQFYNAI